VFPLAVAPVEGSAWRVDGHADLAFDRLHASQLPRAGDARAGSPVAGPGAAAGGPEPALQRLTAQVERAVAGGRVMLTFPTGRGPSDATRLRRARLEAGAALLERLVEAANHRPRDAFGRLGDDDGADFARAWLAAAAYADAAGRALAEASWLPPEVT
jgi:hypothetical protein